jgi:hypothetical protein
MERILVSSQQLAGSRCVIAEAELEAAALHYQDMTNRYIEERDQKEDNPRTWAERPLTRPAIHLNRARARVCLFQSDRRPWPARPARTTRPRCGEGTRSSRCIAAALKKTTKERAARSRSTPSNPPARHTLPLPYLYHPPQTSQISNRDAELTLISSSTSKQEPLTSL